MKNLFILLCCFFAILPIFSKAQNNKIPFTIENWLQQRTFQSKGIPGLESMIDGQSYTSLEGKEIVKYSYKTGEKIKVMLSATEINDSRFDEIPNYEFNDDETKVLLYLNFIEIYRYSFTADYFVFDLATKKLTPVSENGQQRLATFSPDGTKIAFVRENNLFVKNLITLEENQITRDGKINFIINGVPDWVYEEEFQFNRAFEWSPDSKKIAFFRFNESRVKEYTILFYQCSNPQFTENALYPNAYKYKYPKPGEENSIVSIHVYNLENQTTQTMDVGSETNQYIPHIQWTNNPDQLAVLRLNRLQNNLDILLCDASTGVSKVIYNEVNKYYIDESNFDNLEFTDDGKYFLFSSEKDGYFHIYLYNMDGSLKNQVTKGSWDVAKVYGLDQKRKLLYFSSTEGSPLRRKLYSIKIDGTGKTCLTPGEGTNTATFSSDFSFFINRFSNVSTPSLTTLNDFKGKQIRVLENNQKLKDTLQYYQFSPKEFFTFKTSEGVELNGWMIKPYGFDPSNKYPVLMTQYSGPNSQEVLDRWGIGWDDVLASEGYIVIDVDGRGTGGRGEEFRKMTYLQLGKYELIDQIESAKYLKTLPYVDSTRIGMWGWSYGGFMTLLCMTRGAEHFKTGIAVASVTNWRYYDDIYTERFMRTPQENPTGYDDNSPINYASQLKGNLLIIHGDADDNVHPQNSMEMIDRLVQADKPFEMAVYPNRNHSIYGGKTRIHLYHRLNSYILKNL